MGKKLLLSLLTLLIVFASQAQSQTLYEKGEQAMNRGYYNTAIDFFNTYKDITKSPVEKRNCNNKIAFCYKRLEMLKIEAKPGGGNFNNGVSKPSTISRSQKPAVYSTSNYKYPEITILGKDEFRIDISEEGGSYKLPVALKDAENWTATDSESAYLYFGRSSYMLGDWIEINENHTGNQMIGVEIFENEEIGPRTKEIQLVTKPDGKTARILINQQGLPYDAHCAYILGLNVEHNKRLLDGNGMVIHLRVRVRNMANLQCKACVFFYYDEDDPVKDKDENGDYGNIAGNVLVGKEFQPSNNDQTFEDLQLAIPYAQLHQEGNNDREIKMRVSIFDYSVTKHKTLKRSDFYTMLYSPEDYPADKPSPIVIEDLVVEKDVEMSENVNLGSIKGLLVKFRMETNNLKGKNCRVFAQFYDGDYNPITKKEDTSQQIETCLDFLPVTNDQAYKLIQLQMPYRDIENNTKKAYFKIGVYEVLGDDLRFLYESNYMEVSIP